MNDKPHVIMASCRRTQCPHQNEVYMPTSACPFRASSEPLASQNRRVFSALRVLAASRAARRWRSATAEVLGITQRWGKDHPEAYRPDTTQFSGRVVSINEEIVRDARPILLALLATATLVLLIACANVANLSLSRMARRGREMAMPWRSGLGRAAAASTPDGGSIAGACQRSLGLAWRGPRSTCSRYLRRGSRRG
jgi:hypothetical protein